MSAPAPTTCATRATLCPVCRRPISSSASIAPMLVASPALERARLSCAELRPGRITRSWLPRSPRSCSRGSRIPPSTSVSRGTHSTGAQRARPPSRCTARLTAASHAQPRLDAAASPSSARRCPHRSTPPRCLAGRIAARAWSSLRWRSLTATRGIPQTDRPTTPQLPGSPSIVSPLASIPAPSSARRSSAGSRRWWPARR
mmetsp:Transcript_74974/g.199939  ORF Transcript_74974/g.199939 Transcript_74974/m.199939 type:complete len:201 (+) Transcript_74974:2436-3038(+)